MSVANVAPNSNRCGEAASMPRRRLVEEVGAFPIPERLTLGAGRGTMYAALAC